MLAIPLSIYLVLCVVVAFRGRRTPLGVLGTFLISIVLTPIIVFVGLILMTPSPSEMEIVYRKAEPHP
jgi:hypothetical protein